MIEASRSGARSRSVAGRVAAALTGVPGGELPIRLRTWDGSEVGPDSGPVLLVHHRRALRRLWSPDGLGLADAYLAGDVEIEGDLTEALSAWWTWTDSGSGLRPPARAARRLVLAARWGTVGRRLPAASRPGNPRQPRRPIAAGVDELPTAFAELVFGPSMASFCGYFYDGPAGGLAEAQQAGLDRICQQLGLGRGIRHLDVACGWGSLICYAAERYGTSSTGLTRSRQQYEYVSKRVADAGLTDRVEVHLADHDGLDFSFEDGQFDAVSAIEVGEFVAHGQSPAFATAVHRVLRPGGRILVQQVSPGVNPLHGLDFVNTYIAPGGRVQPVDTTVSLLDAAGLEVQDVQSLREHYGWTMTAWAESLERSWNGAVDLIGDVGTRAWQLYLTGGALAFAQDRLGVGQILAVRPPAL